MDIIVPYVFFIYMFIATWLLMMNYETIKGTCSSRRIAIGYVSVAIALFVFVGVAVLYNIDSSEEDYKEKTKMIKPNVSIFLR